MSLSKTIISNYKNLSAAQQAEWKSLTESDTSFRQLLREYVTDRASYYTAWKNARKLVDLFVAMGYPTAYNVSTMPKRERQRLATIALNLYQAIKEEEHADEVVEPTTLSSEDVHGNDDITKDIEDAPERKEADGSDGDGEDENNASGGNNDTDTGDNNNGEDGEGSGTSPQYEGKSDQGKGLGVANIEDIVAEMLSPATETQFSGNGRSMTYQTAKALPVARELQALFEKLAYESAPYGRTDRKERWDGQRLIRGKFSPNRLPKAKSGREVDHNIYFVLDDSGSMSVHAEMFLGLLEASKHVVKVYTGSEAHPCEAVDGSYKAEYRFSFLLGLKKWLEATRPAPGSVLLFWGDTCDMHIRGEETQVKKLLSKYRAYWLGTYANYHYKGWEQPSVKKAGFKVIAPVATPQELRQAIKKIR